MRQPRQVQIIAGRVNSDGTLAAASDPGVSSIRTGTGSYQVRLPVGFNAISATLSNVLANNIQRWDAAPAGNLLYIQQYNNALGVADGAFSFVAVGYTT